MANIKSALVSGGCLVLFLVLLPLGPAVVVKTESVLWCLSLLALAFGIPIIVYLVYDKVAAATRFARLYKSTDPRFSILQAHGYEIEVGRYLREVRDRGDSGPRRADTESFREDIKRQHSNARWAEYRMYEWLGDFDQAGDAGNFPSGLEAAKRLVKQSEQTTNAIGKRATSGFSGLSEKKVELLTAEAVVFIALIVALVVGVGKVIDWTGKKWKDDSCEISCVLILMGVVVWAVHAFIKERRRGNGR